MVSYKFIAASVLGFVMISAVISAGLNSCGTTGDAMPAKSSDCLSDKNLAEGAKCCYLSANLQTPSTNTTTISVCTLLPKGVNETTIQEAAKALGNNSTWTCNASYMAVSTLLLFVLALMF